MVDDSCIGVTSTGIGGSFHRPCPLVGFVSGDIPSYIKVLIVNRPIWIVGGE